MDLPSEFAYILGALLCLAIGIIYYQYAYGTIQVGMPTVSSGTASIGMQIFSSLVNIIPIGLLTSGFISDGLNYEIKLGIPSYASLITLVVLLFASKIAGANMPGFTEANFSDSGQFWCTLPGLEFLENMWFPSSIFTSMTIALYYFWWSVNNSTSNAFHSSGGLVAFILATNLIGFLQGKCGPYYTSLYPGLGPWAVILQTYLLCLFVSGVTYGVVSGMPNKNPFDNFGSGGSAGAGAGSAGSGTGGFGGYGTGCPPGQQKTERQYCIVCDPTTSIVVGENCVKRDDVKSVSSSQTASPSNTEQTFVAELYKNGQLVTESISK
jgi:hypothetical protein